MSAHNMSQITTNFNHLRRGGTYRAITSAGSTFGEYLGMEGWYGERAVMLRDHAGTVSLLRTDILSIELAA